MKKQNKQDFLKQCTIERMNNGAERTDAFTACSLEWDRMTAQALSSDDRQMELSANIEMAPSTDKGLEARRFIIDAYTGAPLDLFFGGRLYIDINGIDANSKIPILREHVRDRPVGFATPFIEENKFFVDGRFSEYSADAKEIISLADEGYPWEASIGIWAKAVRQLQADEKMTVNGADITGPATVWTQSKVREVSFVALGADENTAAIVMNAGSDTPVEYKTDDQEDVMDITRETLAMDAPELLAGIEQDAVEAERARIIEILEADGDKEVTMAAIKDGTAPGAVYKQFFEAEKARKVGALNEMAAEAPPSMGAEEPPEPEPTQAADVALATRAAKIAQEKGLDLAEATRQALFEDKDLAKRWGDNLMIN